jgi:hypothetical protein
MHYIVRLGSLSILLLHVLFLMKLPPSHSYGVRRDCRLLKRDLLFCAACFENNKSAFVLMSDYLSSGYEIVRVVPAMCYCTSEKKKDWEENLFSSLHCIAVKRSDIHNHFSRPSSSRLLSSSIWKAASDIWVNTSRLLGLTRGRNEILSLRVTRVAA